MNRRFFIILFCLTLVFKLTLAIYFAHAAMRCGAPKQLRKINRIAFAAGDTDSYLAPADNLIEGGAYRFWNGARFVSAGRMPYYAAPYFALRLFFDKPAAADLLVALQILASALASVLFARLCLDVIETAASFWAGYALYLLSFNLSALDSILLPESFALSLTIVFLYFYQRFGRARNRRTLLVAAIFWALLTSLKPYLLLLFPFLLLGAAGSSRELLKIKNVRSNARRVAGAGLLIALPLILLLSPWAIRNRIVVGKLIFSQEDEFAGYDYSMAELAARRFFAAWGNDFIGINPHRRNPTRQFYLETNTGGELVLPAHALTDGYNLAEVERVRAEFLRLQKDFSPANDAAIAREFDRLTEIYRREKPFVYYLAANLIETKSFLLHTNSYYLVEFFDSSQPWFQSWQTIFRLANALIYLAAISLGWFGVAYLVVRGKIGIVFAGLPTMLILLFAFYYKHAEARYFLQAIPALLLGTTFVFARGFSLAIKHLKQRQSV